MRSVGRRFLSWSNSGRGRVGWGFGPLLAASTEGRLRTEVRENLDLQNIFPFLLLITIAVKILNNIGI